MIHQIEPSLVRSDSREVSVGLDRFRRKPDGTWVAEVRKRGRDVLRNPLINKGTAFSPQERRALQLEGLLPCHVATLDEQAARICENLDRVPDAIGKYVELTDLHDRNETLFYRMLVDRTEALLPIVYTPTVGEASRNFSRIFRRGRGRWITPRHRGHIKEILGHVEADIRLIVATDNERILGLGDQGAGGMMIPIGKLSLYTVAAGIHPSQTLPISLDVGTNNQRLLDDPMYLGWPEPRLVGQEYEEFIEEFVRAVREIFPRALLQWEDFKKGNAFRLLDRYRDILPSFNDDIQGTAAVAVAGVLAACRIAGQSLQQQRVVILGAGAAGIGIAKQLRHSFAQAGLSGADLISRVANLDSGGLMMEGRELTDDYKRDAVWPAEVAASFGFGADRVPDLAEVVDKLRPTVLIGLSGQPGLFTETIVRSMASHCERPAIFPFSNPTSRSEAIPADLIQWTEGRALIATGSPFDPVRYRGRTHRISQGNNVYVFPGVGLGALASGARQVTDAMFARAATVLAGEVSQQTLDRGEMYPPLSELRATTRRMAEAVGEQAIRDGVAKEPEGGIPAAVQAWMWMPEYPEIVPI